LLIYSSYVDTKIFQDFSHNGKAVQYVGVNVLWLDEETSLPVDKSSTYAAPKKTGTPKSSKTDIVSDVESENNCRAGLQYTDSADEDGVVTVTADDRSAENVNEEETKYNDRQQSSTTSESLLVAMSGRLDGGSDDDSCDASETEQKEGGKRCKVRTYSSKSSTQVSPKRGRFKLEDNVDGDSPDESDDDEALHEKMSL